jgi:two-component system, LytTR family, response regulator
MGQSITAKLNALIIDDEISGRTMIEYYLKEFAGDIFNKMTSVSSLKEALTFIEKSKPDIIFTDYELRNETGLMISHHIHDDTPVVVVSAHSQYALEAIQSNVFDYLLKPLSEPEILRFKARLQKKILREGTATFTPNFDDHLLIKDAGENIMVAHQDILFIEAAGAYSKIVTEAKNFIASKTLKSIELQLPSIFIRIHRSYIVPLNQISSYSSQMVCLKNGNQLALSKTGKKLLQSFI